MTSAKFWDFLTPSSPRPHLGLIYSTKFTQPPLLHLLLGYPPPSVRTRTPYMDAPWWDESNIANVEWTRMSETVDYHKRFLQRWPNNPERERERTHSAFTVAIFSVCHRTQTSSPHSQLHSIQIGIASPLRSPQMPGLHFVNHSSAIVKFIILVDLKIMVICSWASLMNIGGY